MKHPVVVVKNYGMSCCEMIWNNLVVESSWFWLKLGSNSKTLVSSLDRIALFSSSWDFTFSLNMLNFSSQGNLSFASGSSFSGYIQLHHLPITLRSLKINMAGPYHHWEIISSWLCLVNELVWRVSSWWKFTATCLADNTPWNINMETEWNWTWNLGRGKFLWEASFSGCHLKFSGCTRWAPTSYKWSYNPYGRK